ncbi:MAG TPA: DUF5666 domain-containing protein [Thermomicrobiales bacterium]|nr:DUF5666 domain-containing protein [Thermomicrobiales bacterium]
MPRLSAVGVFVLVMLLVAACGSSATPTVAPAAAPTSAPTAAPTAAPTPAATSSAASASPGASPARALPTFVTGTIQSITADEVTLADGQHFATTPKTSYVKQVAMAPGDLQTGMYAGITAKRQGDNSLLASVIDVFAQKGTGSQFPLPGGALMTNATIDKIDGNTLTVSWPGGGALVKLDSGTKIYRDQPGTAADAKVGSAVTVVEVNGTAAALRLP